MSRAALEPRLFDKHRRRFLLRKLHSLTGVVPVGLFVVFHLFTNARALRGEASFSKAVEDIQAIPYLPVIEAVAVLGPLLFHALYGVKLAFESRPNVGSYPFNRNWMYTAQRVTGLLAFAFIVWHLSTYWYARVTGHLAPEQFYGALCQDLSSAPSGIPVAALAYVFGIAAVVFHLANGLWGFCFSWGITVSRRSQRISATVFGLIGLIVFLLGANTAIYFATGSRVAVFGTPADSPIARARSCADIQAGSGPFGSSKTAPASGIGEPADRAKGAPSLTSGAPISGER